MTNQIGALTIGQSPRPDLTVPLRHALPYHLVMEKGALDGIDARTIPDGASTSFPLTTRLRDRSTVTVPEEFLLPRLQQMLDEFEAAGVAATMLMCAGSFNKLQGKMPLFKPFDVACAALKSMGIRELAIMCPVPEQEAPTAQRWTAAGFTVQTAFAAAPDMRDERLGQWIQAAQAPDCLVIDYVGHPPEAVKALQEALTVPVVDVGHLTIQTLATVMG